MSTVKKAPATLGAMALTGALIISTPVAANSTESIAGATTAITATSLEDLNNYDSFDDTPATGVEAPEATNVGSQHGPGISEVLTEETRNFVSESRAEQGKSALPVDTYAMRYLDSGAIYAVDEAGAITLEIASPDPIAGRGEITTPLGDGSMSARSWTGVKDEAKAIIEACLGVGIFGGISAETITRWVGTPAKAAKFVVRRLGVFGAVSCAGGVIWRYI